MIKDLNHLISQNKKKLSLCAYVEHSNPSFIPVHITGGIGDCILSIELLRYLQSKYQIIIYTKHKKALEYFTNEFIIHETLPNYTWHLELDTVVNFRFSSQFSGFLIKDHEKLFLTKLQINKNNPQLNALCTHLRDDFYLAAIYGKENGLTRRTLPARCLGIDNELPFTSASRQESRQYITIHDGFDTQSKPLVNGGRSTKQWSLVNWVYLIDIIKRFYPTIPIIQLGSSTGRPILGVDQCLLDKTTITEAFDILSHSILHIDGDSGLVHAATRMQVPCVVMWGSTPMEFYGYPQNINLKSNICDHACYGTTNTWMDKCPIGYAHPKCIDEIKPETVFKEIKKALDTF